jgi:superfamily II DNA helicase RecQ
MAALVRHFGDFEDSQKPCGICDFCAPAECIGQKFRPLIEVERATLQRIVATLQVAGTNTTGRLHSALFPNGDMSRTEFEELLGAMARGGLVRLIDAVFEKDGKSIPYKKVTLTPAGAAIEAGGGARILMKDEAATKAGGRKRKRKGGAGKLRQGRKPKVRVEARPAEKPAPKAASRPAAKATPQKAPVESKKEAPKALPPASRPQAIPDVQVEAALRAWRMGEAKRRGLPPFKIVSDQALKAVALKRPGTAAELLAIPGIGISTVEKYGAQLYRILHERRS